MIWIYISLGFFLVSLFPLLLLPSRIMLKFFGGTKSPSDILKYIGTVCGAIIVIGTLYETSQTNNLTRKGQLDNRFIEANNLLASDNVSANIAGIYALYQIAIEASNDETQLGYVQVVKDILSATIRENSKIENDTTYTTKPVAVFQTIIDVLLKTTFDYSTIGAENRLILSSYDEDNAGFTATFSSEPIIDLHNSVLNHCDLGFILPPPNKRRGVKINLRGCFLYESVLINSSLKNVDLSESFLGRAKLDFADLEKANFKRAYLSEARLWAVNLDSANLSYAFLQADLKGASLKGTDLDFADLKGADLTNAHLEYTDFSRTYLDENTNFKGTIHEGKSIEEIKTYKPPHSMKK